MSDLSDILINKKSSCKELEKIIGRLNHAGSACPSTQYYISGPRKTLEHWNRSTVNAKVKKYLPKTALPDLHLWYSCCLPKIHKGISLNLISYRRPTNLCWSDACPQGIVGYNDDGVAWRLEIPTEFKEFVRLENNTLEFVASMVSVWLTILTCIKEEYPCFLALGDNMPAVSWLHKANVDENENKPLHLATRKYAEILMQHNCCLYSQHIQGEKNKVADALSRLHHLSPLCMHTYIISNFPSQVPPTFCLVPLPPKISSWVTSWLLKIRDLKESEKVQKVKKREFGNDGVNIAPSPRMTTTYTYRVVPPSSEQDCLELLPQPNADDNFLLQTRYFWEQPLLKRPWRNGVRSLGQTWGTTPPMAAPMEDGTHHLLDK
jgi:hypothetical protein